MSLVSFEAAYGSSYLGDGWYVRTVQRGPVMTFWYHRGRPYAWVYAASLPMADYCGMTGQQLKEDCMTFLKSKAAVRVGTGASVPAEDAEWLKRYPALFEYMTALVDPDGCARKPASMVLFTEDGVWKVCLTDRHTQLQMWAAGETVGKMLQALDKLLSAEDSPWRAVKEYTPAKKAR